MTFRFDDVCINSDMELHNQMTDWLFEKFPDCEVMWSISPLVHSNQNGNGRVFPKEWNAYSDYLVHCRLDSAGIPPIHFRVTRATHGLIHVDHRLLTREAQELSIVLSSHLVKSNIFVPPFNKWNSDTSFVCAQNNIMLIRFENGWKSMEHNQYDKHHEQWYLHAREWTFESFKKWFE